MQRERGQATQYRLRSVAVAFWKPVETYPRVEVRFARSDGWMGDGRQGQGEVRREQSAVVRVRELVWTQLLGSRQGLVLRPAWVAGILFCSQSTVRLV